MSAFIDALGGAERPMIMELKPRSADGDDLLRDRTPAEIVSTYEAAGAPCLSVVTGRWFGGTTDLLREVVGITRLPVLQKDFITNADQLREALRLGASAVLLTAALLPRVALTKLVDSTLSLGLTPFVEVTSEAEIAAVPRPAECVIAVNNKDIGNRERGAADIDRSLGLLPALLQTGTRCPVSASGIDRADDAARLLDAGFAGLLIGTSLLRADRRIEAWLDDVDDHRQRGRAPEVASDMPDRPAAPVRLEQTG